MTDSALAGPTSQETAQTKTIPHAGRFILDIFFAAPLNALSHLAGAAIFDHFSSGERNIALIQLIA
jgi:hypothetical protein